MTPPSGSAPRTVTTSVDSTWTISSASHSTCGRPAASSKRQIDVGARELPQQRFVVADERADFDARNHPRLALAQPQQVFDQLTGAVRRLQRLLGAGAAGGAVGQLAEQPARVLGDVGDAWC